MKYLIKKLQGSNFTYERVLLDGNDKDSALVGRKYKNIRALTDHVIGNLSKHRFVFCPEGVQDEIRGELDRRKNHWELLRSENFHAA